MLRLAFLALADRPFSLLAVGTSETLDNPADTKQGNPFFVGIERPETLRFP